MAFRLLSAARALPRVCLRASVVKTPLLLQFQRRSLSTGNNQDDQPQSHVPIVDMKEQADFLVSQLSPEEREQMKKQLEQLLKDAGEPAADASEGIWDRTRYREVDDLFSNLAEIDQVQSSHPQEVEEVQPFAKSSETEPEAPIDAVNPPQTPPAQPQQPSTDSAGQAPRQPKMKNSAILLMGLTSLALLKLFYDMTQREEAAPGVAKKEAGARAAK